MDHPALVLGLAALLKAAFLGVDLRLHVLGVDADVLGVEVGEPVQTELGQLLEAVEATWHVNDHVVVKQKRLQVHQVPDLLLYLSEFVVVQDQRPKRRVQVDEVRRDRLQGVLTRRQVLQVGQLVHCSFGPNGLLGNLADHVYTISFYKLACTIFLLTINIIFYNEYGIYSVCFSYVISEILWNILVQNKINYLLR